MGDIIGLMILSWFIWKQPHNDQRFSGIFHHYQSFTAQSQIYITKVLIDTNESKLAWLHQNRFILI